MSNETFLGSRRLCIPYDPLNNHNGHRGKPDNGKARFGEVDSQLCLSPGVIYFPPSNGRERLPISALSSGINFAEYAPSGNGISPKHLETALGYLRTPPERLIVNADPQECQELLLSLSRLFQAHDVGHLVVAADGLEAPLGFPTLVATAKMWHVPILVNFDGDGSVQEVTEIIRRAEVPVALGIPFPSLVFQEGFRVMNI